MTGSMPDGVTSSGQKKNRQTDLEWSPVGAEVDRNRNAHGKSDVDSGPDALHHTLGRKPFQAAPGSLTEMTAIVGQTFMWFANTPPKGFIILNGQTLSRTDYQELWNFASDNALVGSQIGDNAKPFGNGDGSTTFTVPDMYMRVPIAVAVNAGENDGTTGSSYRRRMWNLNHRHTIPDLVYEGGSVSATTSSAGGHSHTVSISGAGDHSHTINSETLNQEGNTTVGGTNNRLTGPATHTHSMVNAGEHSHGGTANTNGAHTHSVDTSASHTHPGFQTDRIFPSAYGPSVLIGGESEPSRNTTYCAVPYMEVIWVMRYTSLFDFEGAVQPPASE